MPNFYPWVRPAVRMLQPETARDWTVWCLERGLGRLMVNSSARRPDPLLLSQQLWDIEFPNPIGIAAGLDKDAQVPDAILNDWRCGFVEVGTVTPKYQKGNDTPRIFRLDEDEAVINRMGFNSCGLGPVIERLKARAGLPGIVGLNLGKNRETDDAAADYEKGIYAAAKLVNYLVVNISSPNTPGLRDLQRRAALQQLLSRLIAARETTSPRTPLLIKIAPDLSLEECKDIASVALNCGLNGIIVSNTTTDRPSSLRSLHAREQGGLSGAPLFERSTKILAHMYILTEGKLPLIGVGGVSCALDAYEKLCAGASLVQLYTGVAFQGPMLVSEIKWGLAELLKENGFSSIQEAVGTRSAAWVASDANLTSPTVQEVNGGMPSRTTRRFSRAPSPMSTT
jgi:dihydroorotate dehydrogenase